MEIQAVGIASISYDDESRELINMRNKGAMLGDPVKEGYVQGSIARGLEAAGSNQGGCHCLYGYGYRHARAGNFMGAASQANQRQMELEQAQNTQNTQKNHWFCTNCGAKNLVTSAVNVEPKGQAPMYVPSVVISHRVKRKLLPRMWQ